MGEFAPTRYRIGNVAIDCADLEKLVPFWAEALGYEVKSRDESHALLRDPERLGPKIYLQPVPESKVVKNRVHMDVYVVDPEEAAERLVGLGATILQRFDQEDDRWIVMGDPEGNEFCLVEAGEEGVRQPFV